MAPRRERNGSHGYRRRARGPRPSGSRRPAPRSGGGGGGGGRPREGGPGASGPRAVGSSGRSGWLHVASVFETRSRGGDGARARVWADRWWTVRLRPPTSFARRGAARRGFGRGKGAHGAGRGARQESGDGRKLERTGFPIQSPLNLSSPEGRWCGRGTSRGHGQLEVESSPLPDADRRGYPGGKGVGWASKVRRRTPATSLVTSLLRKRGGPGEDIYSLAPQAVPFPCLSVNTSTELDTGPQRSIGRRPDPASVHGTRDAGRGTCSRRTHLHARCPH